ncbi:IS5 family transposase [Methylobacterium sp. E-065]|uniref:IS5 family transposase n=1 Tax=Methylobacterium sp. E-065 TaxID=2836583 RepID=UPI001FBBF7F0|nr:IS5 family transposase [Methylobacterium sp. E-065]MCJ2020814.1 IS5 family transposase [Methylobacterium sp. E-065]
MPSRPRPAGGGSPIANRAALTGILFVLCSGLPWGMLPAEMGCGSDISCWRLLRDWQAAGVWSRLHAAGQIDWRRACLDSASVPANGGGCHRPEPDGLGQGGYEAPPRHRRARHAARLLPSGANRHESVMMAATLDAIPPLRSGRRGRPRRRPDKLHADKAYDARRRRHEYRARGIMPRIARPGIESSERLGRHRWVVERTHAWFNRYRRLPVRCERRAGIYEAFTSLIARNQIKRFR